MIDKEEGFGVEFGEVEGAVGHPGGEEAVGEGGDGGDATVAVGREGVEGDDVEIGVEQQAQTVACGDQRGPDLGGGAGFGEDRTESGFCIEWEAAEGGPERGGGSAGARAFETDFAKVEIV